MSLLNLSAFKDDSDASNEGDDDAQDPVIRDLQNQIHDAEMSLDQILARKEENKERHERELMEIAQSIEEAKKYSEEALERQRIEQSEELRNMEHEYEDERRMFEHNLQQQLQQNQVFAQRSNDVIYLSDQSKMADLERKVEQEKARNQEINANQEAALLQKILSRKAKSFNIQSRFQALEKEISSLQGTRRELAADLRLKMSELTTKIQMKRVEHVTLLRRLDVDMQAREKEYNLHVETVKLQLEKEKKAIETELDNTTARYKSLQKYYQAMTKRSTQQLARLTHDIEKMKRDLELMQRDDGSNEKEIKEKLKMQHLEKQVQGNRDRVAQLESDINLARTQCNVAYNHLLSSQQNSSNSNARPLTKRSKNSIF